jgi:hypothetical protein
MNSCASSNEPLSATLTGGLRVLTPDLVNRRWIIFLTELSEIPRLSDLSVGEAAQDSEKPIPLPFIQHIARSFSVDLHKRVPVPKV